MGALTQMKVDYSSMIDLRNNTPSREVREEKVVCVQLMEQVTHLHLQPKGFRSRTARSGKPAADSSSSGPIVKTYCICSLDIPFNDHLWLGSLRGHGSRSFVARADRELAYSVFHQPCEGCSTTLLEHLTVVSLNSVHERKHIGNLSNLDLKDLPTVHSRPDSSPTSAQIDHLAIPR